MCTPGGIAQALGIADTINIPSMNNRDHNFDKFVKQHFFFKENEDNDQFLYIWLPNYRDTSAYKTIKAYPKIPYGAVMIQRILRDHKIKGRVPFKVKRFNDSGPKGLRILFASRTGSH